MKRGSAVWWIVPCALVAVLVTAGSPDEAPGASSGFLPDYTRLRAAAIGPQTHYYLAPEAPEKIATYRAVMIDQPEVFLAEDSPYRGIQPSRIAAIAEAMRGELADALGKTYPIVDEPGPDVMYLRLALVDLSIKKKRRKVLGYTPVGLVFKGARHAAEGPYANAVRHYSLLDLKIEGQLLDSETGTVLGEFVDARDRTDDPETWKELRHEMRRYASVLHCRLSHAPMPPEEWPDCHAEAERAR